MTAPSEAGPLPERSAQSTGAFGSHVSTGKVFYGSARRQNLHRFAPHSSREKPPATAVDCAATSPWQEKPTHPCLLRQQRLRAPYPSSRRASLPSTQPLLPCLEPPSDYARLVRWRTSAAAVYIRPPRIAATRIQRELRGKVVGFHLRSFADWVQDLSRRSGEGSHELERGDFVRLARIPDACQLYHSTRTSLFDGIEEGGIRASSYSSHEIDEHENNQAIDGLQDRVSILKRLSGNIHEEVETHNRTLDRMGNDMDSSRGFLSGTVDKFKMVFETKSSQRMGILVASFGALFMLIYYLSR